MESKFVFTSSLGDKLDEFLKYKRLCGYKYVNEAFLLNRFDKFIKESAYDIGHLSKEAVYAWLNHNSSQSSKSKSLKCSLLREFGVYLNTFGFEAFILPQNAVRKTKSDFTPYIFSREELSRLFVAIDNSTMGLHKNDDFPSPSLIFRILYGCGLRSSEALKLTISDVDLKNGILVIRDSKNHNSRLVAMDNSLVEVCEDYMLKYHKNSDQESFLFPTRFGINKPYAHGTIYWHFREALNVCGINHSGRGNGPRLHDLRHTFSVHSLNKMVKCGMDIYTSLPVLSSYLGHKSILGTQQYLRLTIEIYPEITEAMEERCHGIFPEVSYDEEI